MIDTDADRDPVEALAEEFMQRQRAGEQPSIEQYAQQYPELAEEIRELFPTLAMMEQYKPSADSTIGAASGNTQLADPQIKQLGDFRILREVGRGGMGIVYEAEQVSLGRHVALKVLPRELLGDSKYKQRFEREARSAARLHHTNIVPVFGVGDDQGYHFYVMQYIRGHGLDEVIDELRRLRGFRAHEDVTDPVHDHGEPRSSEGANTLARSLMSGAFSLRSCAENREDKDGQEHAIAGSAETVQGRRDDTPNLRSRSERCAQSNNYVGTSELSDADTLWGQSISEDQSGHHASYWASVARIGIQVANALQHAHDQNVVHRDIKPSNLLLDTRGTVWITDFGLAKAEDHQDLTHAGDIVGTLRYMAPESLQGKTDARSDIYSLGLTLYELVALRPAYSSDDRHGLIREITDSEPPRLPRLNTNVPRDLATVIHKAIERDPQHRYTTAQDLANDLQCVLEDRPIRARRITTAERFVRWSRRNKALAASMLATSVLLLLIAIGGTVWAFRESRGLAGVQQLLDQANALAEDLMQTSYAQSMVIVGHALQTPSGGAAVGRNLDPWRPETVKDKDRRGWEWYCVDSMNQSNRAAVFDITATDFHWHPNGDWLAFGGCDGIVRVWKGGMNENIIRLLGHTGPVMSVRWSPDGKLLATAGLDGQTLLWKAEDWSCLHTVLGKRHIEWSPTAAQFAVVDENTVRVWSRSGQEERSFLGSGTSRFRWNHDGTRLTFNDGAHKVRMWNVVSQHEDNPVELSDEKWIQQWRWNEAGELDILVRGNGMFEIETYSEGKQVQSRFVVEDEGGLSSAQFSPVSTSVALAGQLAFTDASKLAIQIIDPNEPRRTLLVGHRTPNTFLAWHPAGRLLATSGRDRTLRIWDTATSAQLQLFQLPATGGEIAWNPQGTKLVNASTQLEVFDLSRAEPDQQRPPCTPSFSISPDGRHIALGELGNAVRFWDLLAQKEDTSRALSFGEPVRRVAYSPNGKTLAAAVGDGRTIVVWDLASGSVIRSYDFDWNPRSDRQETWSWLSWSPDSSQLAAAGPGGAGIHVVSISEGRVELIPCSRGVNTFNQTHLVWSPCGSKIISLPGHHYAELLDAEDPRHIIRLDGHEQWERNASWLLHAAFSPDGQKVVTSSVMGTLRIWDVATGRPLHTLESQEAEGADVSWSPGGNRIASGDSNGGLKIWDAASGRELLSLQIGEGSINQIAWTPDGSRIIAHVFGQEHLVILDANPSYVREHVAAGLARLDTELQWDPSDLHNLLGRAEINLRRDKWQDVLRDATQVNDANVDDAAFDDMQLAIRAALFVSLADAQLGNEEAALRSTAAVDELLNTTRQMGEHVLPEVSRAFTESTTPFAWNAAAQMELNKLRQGDVERAVSLAESAVRVLPECGQFRVTLGVARYRNGEYELACAELHEATRLFATCPEQIDRQYITNMRMQLFRAAGYLRGNRASAEHIVNQRVLSSLDFMTNEVKAGTSLNPIALTALGQYFAWFQHTTIARTLLHLAMAEYRVGNRKSATQAFDNAESILKVCANIDNETLAVWAEAVRLIR